MSKAYTSNLTRDQFELIEPMLPKAKPRSRPGDGHLGLDRLRRLTTAVEQGIYFTEETLDCEAHLWLVAMVTTTPPGL
jgi:hypothetical protein